MEIRGRRIVLPLVLSVALSLACAVSALGLKYFQAAESPDLANVLQPSPDGLDFGEVWDRSDFSSTLSITNRWQEDIEIKRFNVTCTCTRIEPSTLVIRAGQTRDVRLDLNLRTNLKPGLPVQDFEAQISPEFSVGKPISESIWWTIRGRVRSAMQFDPSFVDFGRVSELAQPKMSGRTTIKALTSIQKLTATSTSPNYSVEVKKRTLDGSDLFDLIVTPQKPLSKGAILFSVDIVPELADGSCLPVRQLQVAGKIVGDVESSPQAVINGACLVGTTLEHSIVLRSLTGGPFDVTEVRCEGEGLSIERVGNEPSFRITQRINARGDQLGKVILGVRTEVGRNDEVVVPVSSFGI
jgi:hypothetical protein